MYSHSHVYTDTHSLAHAYTHAHKSFLRSRIYTCAHTRTHTRTGRTPHKHRSRLLVCRCCRDPQHTRSARPHTTDGSTMWVCMRKSVRACVPPLSTSNLDYEIVFISLALLLRELKSVSQSSYVFHRDKTILWWPRSHGIPKPLRIWAKRRQMRSFAHFLSDKKASAEEISTLVNQVCTLNRFCCVSVIGVEVPEEGDREINRRKAFAV